MKKKILIAAIVIAILQGLATGYLLTFHGLDTYLKIHFASMKILAVITVLALIPIWFKREQIKQYIKSIK